MERRERHEPAARSPGVAAGNRQGTVPTRLAAALERRRSGAADRPWYRRFYADRPADMREACLADIAAYESVSSTLAGTACRRRQPALCRNDCTCRYRSWTFPATDNTFSNAPPVCGNRCAASEFSSPAGPASSAPGWCRVSLGPTRRFALGAQAVILSRNWAAFCRKAPHLAADPAISCHAGDVRDFAFPEGHFSHIHRRR